MEHLFEVVIVGENSPYLSPSDDEIIEVMQRLRSFVENRLSLFSRWSGQIIRSNELTPAGFMLYAGRKEWSCDITLHQMRLDTIGWYGTALHELIHSVSVGMGKENRRDLIGHRGWEEGVVEALTRSHFVAAIEFLGIGGSFGNRRQYEEFVSALEILRRRTQKDSLPFYEELIRIPLKTRRETVVQWIVETSPTLPIAIIESQMDEVLRRLSR